MHFLVLPLLDDWHLHVRQDDLLPSLLLASARTASRAIIMPNTIPPITDADKAKHYETQLFRALRAAAEQAKIPVPVFRPFMTLYLTDDTTPAQVAAAKAVGVVAYKLYPQGATTNSSNGVTDLARAVPALHAMAEHNIVLCVHGEVVDPSIDIFQREAAFLSTNLPRITAVKGLKVVLEHLTTAAAVRALYRGNGLCSEKYLFPGNQDGKENEHLEGNRASGLDDTHTTTTANTNTNIHTTTRTNVRLAATVTPQHLLLARDALLSGGLRVHTYCLPVLKTERDRRALLWAMGDSPRSGLLFAGTDSAPHTRNKKESCCAPAGCFTSPHALQLYVTAAEQAVMWHALVEEETCRWRQQGCAGEGCGGVGHEKQGYGDKDKDGKDKDDKDKDDSCDSDQNVSRKCEVPSLPALHPLSHAYGMASSLSTPLPPIPHPPRGTETVVGLTETDFWSRLVRVLDAMLRVNGALFYGVAVKRRRVCVGVACDEDVGVRNDSGVGQIPVNKGKWSKRKGSYQEKCSGGSSGSDGGGSDGGGGDGGGGDGDECDAIASDVWWVEEMDVCGLPQYNTGEERQMQGQKRDTVEGGNNDNNNDNVSGSDSGSGSGNERGCGRGRCLRLNPCSSPSTRENEPTKDINDASADCGVRVCVCDGGNRGGLKKVHIGFCRNIMSHGRVEVCDGATEGDPGHDGCVVLVRSPWTVGKALPLRRVHVDTDITANEMHTAKQDNAKERRGGGRAEEPQREKEKEEAGVKTGEREVVGKVVPLLSGEQLPWRAVFSTQLLP